MRPPAASQSGLRDGTGLGPRGDLAAGRTASTRRRQTVRSGGSSPVDVGVAISPLVGDRLVVAAVRRPAPHRRTSSSRRRRRLASEQLAAAFRVVDPEQLRLVGGRFDLDAVRLIEQPFVAVQSVVADLGPRVDRADSPWLVSSVGSRLDDLDAELADVAPDVDDAVDAIRLAPGSLLGADGQRRYFVAFTTPAEARGLGGFMGNWAVLTAVDGRIRLSEFGRTRDLNLGGVSPRYVTGPADFLEQWGRYGFTNGPGGSASPTPWSTVTVSPVLSSTAQVIDELLPQSGVAPVDGAFVIEPEVLEALVGLTGPISVDGSDIRLDEIERPCSSSWSTSTRSTTTPTGWTSSRACRERRSRRCSAGDCRRRRWSPRSSRRWWPRDDCSALATDPDEQDLFESIGLANALPSLDGGDGIAAVFNNAGPNKIDVYLERELSYTAVVDERSGIVTSRWSSSSPTLRTPMRCPIRSSRTPPVTPAARIGRCCRCTRRSSCAT